MKVAMEKKFLDMIMTGNQTFWNFAKKNSSNKGRAAYVFLRRILIHKRNVTHCACTAVTKYFSNSKI